MLGRFPVVLRVCLPKKTQIKPRQLFAYILRPNSVKRVPSGPLPPEQSRVAIHLPTLASTTRRQRYPRAGHPVKMASKKNSNGWVTPTSSASRKKKVKFSKPTSTPETSHGTHRISAAGKLEAPTAETNPFTVLAQKALSPPRAPLEMKKKSIQERKSGDPAHPVEEPLSLIISMSRHPRPAPTRRKVK